MKIAGIKRRNKPNLLLLRTMQLYSTRGWVYRERQGWIFAELTPDELDEFKSYEYGITTPRMRVRLPYSQAVRFLNHETDNLANWFAYCSIAQAHTLAQNNQITDDKHNRYHVESGSYETWLWSDEVEICREVGCEVAVHHGWGWHEWGVPVEWNPLRLNYKECTFIYALVDDLTHEVRYIGKADNPEQRLAEHLRDINNPAKWAWIRSLRAQGRKPKLIILEEVAIVLEFRQEHYWISYYWKRGHNLTNDICQHWNKPKEEQVVIGAFISLENPLT